MILEHLLATCTPAVIVNQGEGSKPLVARCDAVFIVKTAGAKFNPAQVSGLVFRASFASVTSDVQHPND
jgi:hypothetical protein